MAGIRKLKPHEFDADGLPTFQVHIEYLDLDGHPIEPGDVGVERTLASWIAYCPKLPGYWGMGKSQREAIERLWSDFKKDPVCFVPRVKFDDEEATQRLFHRLRDLGGADAASEALQPNVGPNNNPMGVSPTDLFQTRKEWQQIEQMVGGAWKPSDNLIWIMSRFSAGTGPWANVLVRQLRARQRIIRFLKKRRNSGNTG
ncbi:MULTISPECIES: hypothetical protein [unclassified Novosphingobium]|uniref:hypothetical protein n=1 Tax=unclassified Novosphingobium TaxID=2644732 RepID=UPI000B06664F|nr:MULTISPECIES: hypothetical protein [unclassified Novosphingobium]MBN9142267.1 hypothetical protein [Novosphingobium sp.]MDR6710343.1 hypothetical protein [Novosphingobium sp. 1748]